MIPKLFYLNVLLMLIMTSCVVRKVDVEGHRGARGLRPENTLSAFELAIELGVTTLELDIAVSRDREVIVTHNPFIHSKICLNSDGSTIATDSTGHGPLIRSLTLQQIKQYDCGSLNPDTLRFPEPPRINSPGEKMPTLKEVFDFACIKDRNIRFNIELKNDPRIDETIPDFEFVETVVDIIHLCDMQEHVIIQSFNWKMLEMVKGIDPSIRTAGLLGGASYLLVNDTVPSPWLNGIDFNKTGQTALGLLKEARLYVDIFSPSEKLLGSEDSLFLNSSIEELHEAGFQVIPWTVNRQEKMKRLIELGVDGIITDYPDSLIMVLDDLKIKVQ